MDNVLVKLCTKCGRELPATAEFFHLHKIHRDGLSSQCKECRRQNHKEQYSHPDVREQILARVAGGDIPANDISYLVLACPTCNNSKHDKFPWEFSKGGRLL